MRSNEEYCSFDNKENIVELPEEVIQVLYELMTPKKHNRDLALSPQTEDKIMTDANKARYLIMAEKAMKVASNPILSKMAEGSIKFEEFISNPKKLKDVMKPELMKKGLKDKQKKLDTAKSSDFNSVSNQGDPMMSKNPGAANIPPGSRPSGPMDTIAPLFSVKPQDARNCEPMAGIRSLIKEQLKMMFAKQLQQMEAMGFTDEDVNLELLKETGGKAEHAIELALEKLEGSSSY